MNKTKTNAAKSGMTLKEFSADTQAHIRQYAKERGVTPEEVVEQFNRIERGEGNDAPFFTAERNTAERVTRWTAQTVKQIADLRANHPERAAILDGIAENAGLDAVAYIVRNLIEERGINANPNEQTAQGITRRIDDAFDGEGTRTRAAHEREIVAGAISRNSCEIEGLTAAETVALIRKHGRREDTSIREIERRVIRAALAA